MSDGSDEDKLATLIGGLQEQIDRLTETVESHQWLLEQLRSQGLIRPIRRADEDH